MQLETNRLGERASARIGRGKTAEDDAVFRAMLAVVSELGYTNLTFARVADRVGLTPSALVQRFRTKRGLLLAFLDWFQATARAAIVAALNRTPEAPLQALRIGAMNWIALLPNRPEQLANILALFPQLAGDQEIRSKIAVIDRLIEEAIEALLLAAVERGQVKPGNTGLLARTLIAVSRGTLLRWSLIPEGSAAERVQECVNTVLAPYMLPTRRELKGELE